MGDLCDAISELSLVVLCDLSLQAPSYFSTFQIEWHKELYTLLTFLDEKIFRHFYNSVGHTPLALITVYIQASSETFILFSYSDSCVIDFEFL